MGHSGHRNHSHNRNRHKETQYDDNWFIFHVIATAIENTTVTVRITTHTSKNPRNNVIRNRHTLHTSYSRSRSRHHQRKEYDGRHRQRFTVYSFR